MDDARRSDFRTFYAGQAISALGSSFSGFAIPLLIYQLTGSPTALALSFAAGRLPFLFFGLFSGAIADRVDRKRLMFGVTLLQAVLIATIPLLYALHSLPRWWLYTITFGMGALGLLFSAAESAAVPSLVPQAQLATANGRVMASIQVAALAGPPLAGILITVVPITALFLLDALSFLITAIANALVRTSFNADETRTPTLRRTTIRADIAEGMQVVWATPALRSLAALLGLINLVGSVGLAELVLFATERLGATSWQYGLLGTSAGIGIIILSLLAGRLRGRLAYGTAALGAYALSGLVLIAFALNGNIWLALPLWGLRTGLAALGDINTISLRQVLVPSALLGRVVSTMRTIGQTCAPLGALLGSLLIAHTSVAFTYATAGTLALAICLCFAFSPLARSESTAYKQRLDSTTTP